MIELKTRIVGIVIGLIVGLLVGGGTGIVGGAFGGIPGFWVFFLIGGVLGWYVSVDVLKLYRKLKR
ncbi:hypothetical protein [Planktotalea sp.]|uniref:hypothetical protein n=1 Tax=Planktotalea sp. TaxID=2029877 RepID=UPI0032999C33